MASLMIPTSDDESLEAELHLPGTVRAAVVITHPHPQMGGDMFTPVPAGFFNAATGTNVAALRFNFRGTGTSTGTHDKAAPNGLMSLPQSHTLPRRLQTCRSTLPVGPLAPTLH